MKKYDVDTIRIRIWNDPWSETGESYGAGENDVKTSLAIAKRVTEAGFGVLLNFHYSDFWADPGKQFKPKAWASFGVEELDGVYHNFFIPSVGGTNPPTLPDILADGYSVITVDGEDIELFKHSYFTTETEVVKFEINGTKLVVGN